MTVTLFGGTPAAAARRAFEATGAFKFEVRSMPRACAALRPGHGLVIPFNRIDFVWRRDAPVKPAHDDAAASVIELRVCADRPARDRRGLEPACRAGHEANAPAVSVP